MKGKIRKTVSFERCSALVLSWKIEQHERSKMKDDIIEEDHFHL